MADSLPSIFDEGLSYEAELPLEWHPRAEPHGESLLQQMNSAAEQSLRLLSALEEFHPEHVEEHGTGHELARLEFKVNLLLDLVSHLLARQQDLPPPVPVRIGARGLQWHVGDGPAAGSVGEVAIYLNPELARPVRLPARIADPAADGSVVAVFEGLSDPVVDLLEKTVFRRHRRQVAQSRPPRDPS